MTDFECKQTQLHSSKSFWEVFGAKSTYMLVWCAQQKKYTSSLILLYQLKIVTKTVSAVWLSKLHIPRCLALFEFLDKPMKMHNN